MSAPAKPPQLLEQALETLSQPGAWVKGVWARLPSGERVSVYAPELLQATCFCGAGAVVRAGRSDAQPWVFYPDNVKAARQAQEWAAHERGFDDFPTFNDHPDTKLEDVQACMRRAIELARAKEHA